MLLLLLALPACHEAPFHAPQQPDLYKVPYDFGPAPAGDLAGPPSEGDLGVADLSGPKQGPHDLSTLLEDLPPEKD